jgi:ABC-2 type transport system permease protein
MDDKTTIPIYDSAARGWAFLQELRGVFQYQHLIGQMVRRDIVTRYKRSILGVAWTMLNPLGIMIVLAIVFQQVFGGTKSYAAYVLSGLAAWNFFSQATTSAISQLVWGSGLLKKIYVPKTIFALSATGTGAVNLVLILVPLVVVMLMTGVPLTPAALLLPIPILFLAMFTLGIGLLISTIAVYYADVVEMYQIILTAWLYLSPVIYTVDKLPDVFRIWIIRLNPLYHLITLFRAPIYNGRVPVVSEFLISGGISLITLLAGWFVFTRKSDEFAYRI